MNLYTKKGKYSLKKKKKCEIAYRILIINISVQFNEICGVVVKKKKKSSYNLSQIVLQGELGRKLLAVSTPSAGLFYSRFLQCMQCTMKQNINARLLINIINNPNNVCYTYFRFFRPRPSASSESCCVTQEVNNLLHARWNSGARCKYTSHALYLGIYPRCEPLFCPS